jgi:hypothetical protein
LSDKILALFVLCRGLGAIAAIGGAIFLANQGKEGWGWLIFLALCIGCYSIKGD